MSTTEVPQELLHRVDAIGARFDRIEEWVEHLDLSAQAQAEVQDFLTFVIEVAVTVTSALGHLEAACRDRLRVLGAPAPRPKLLDKVADELVATRAELNRLAEAIESIESDDV